MMKITSGILFVFAAAFTLSAASNAAPRTKHDYTREELQGFSKEHLIEIILDMQGGSAGDYICKDLDLNSGSDVKPLVLKKINRPFGDNGSLEWPNGKTFYMRNKGLPDDESMFYPDGKTMVLRHKPFMDDKTSYWPNSKVFVLRHGTFSDDGSAFRSNGDAWLIRHRGFRDDGEVRGLPVEKYEGENILAQASIVDSNNPRMDVKVSGDKWFVIVRVDGATGTASVKECIKP